MIRSKNFTLDGTSQSLADASPNGHRPIKWLRIESVTGNADVKVGDNNLTSTDWGFIVEDGPTASKDIGPFGGGESPFNLEDVYVLGTDAQVLHLSYITL